MANRELRDVYDGTLMTDLYHDEDDEGKSEWLYASLTNDGVEVTKNVAYTPIVMKWFNLPPHLRISAAEGVQLPGDVPSGRRDAGKKTTWSKRHLPSGF